MHNRNWGSSCTLLSLLLLCLQWEFFQSSVFVPCFISFNAASWCASSWVWLCIAQWELVFLHITFACCSAPSVVREFSLLFLPLAWCCKEATIISFNVASSVTFLGFDFCMLNRYWASYTFPFAVGYCFCSERIFSSSLLCCMEKCIVAFVEFWIWVCIRNSGSCSLFSILQFLLPLFKFGFECTTMGIDFVGVILLMCLSAHWKKILKIEKALGNLQGFCSLRFQGISPHILILQNLESSIVKSFIGSEGFLAH